ncbi:MAG: TIGR00282 family metallophosphoesterase [bacterium (Candidatus Ratteibacteria) CG_4_10_14_3_um_filter_41_18]|uniref:TIGR00282 family metallophosphoesterase n=4 Tax=Candidatus Ratteibacteria TaxID=2979319 RepID=A0A2M7YG17_9BACT|nr:MAG: metallophosphoesterase [Candidatus Omnitrophica bacterium CG1_02_41_171]PIV63663.1 MAG: TIGR00282 family metallophosphoesterase [bacterium (Candidatus Ratteibacteria) CG01_land_8_20_14_3_00_40_19]PIW32664.1 MAG: TIGR00282 family metallophosphoesterase [bacterium (Candidatus Ratteibacteria) CG15_BIG_FIL_POST_REV_8_21_14_020_41_12]PIW74416.1 MAG: TIGR00282 family metallophosphoesterase [bacterium (Candidatus Ratteibacteria) CG_4_8_14_3_um_filter_41_36]PIX76917.1 MAG: TIGR00282 family meta
MKILVIGDIVGKSGRKAVEDIIPSLKEEEEIDFVIANGENSAGGSGITPKITQELLACGIDVITTGDHIWKRKEVLEIIDREPRLLRPANYPLGVPGKGSVVIAAGNKVKVGVINLLGRIFMKPLECPFRTAEDEIKKISQSTKIIIVDIHAEATSEKIALGYFLDGKVSAVIGTHTHVQTADEKILPQGTAYITDIGMVGSSNSVLGREIEPIIKRFLTGLPTHFGIAAENTVLSGAILEINPETGRASKIQRITYQSRSNSS